MTVVGVMRLLEKWYWLSTEKFRNGIYCTSATTTTARDFVCPLWLPSTTIIIICSLPRLCSSLPRVRLRLHSGSRGRVHYHTRLVVHPRS